MTTDIYGKGFSFPLIINPHGGVQQAGDAQKVQGSILVILGTQHGDRIMRPTFGCNLRALVFAPNNAATANLARHYVTEGLTTWEPRILLDAVFVQNDPANGRLLIEVSYRLKATYEPQNLVYPFYLQDQ